MKIKLTQTRRIALQAARKKLSSQGREFREEDAMIHELRSLAGTLPDVIAELESQLDPSNDEGLLALATKQAKLKAVLRKLEEAEAVDDVRQIEMRAALGPAAALIGDCLRPLVVEVEGEIAAYLSVVFDEGRAAAEARGSNQVQILAGFAQCNFANFSDLILAAREATRVLDILLSGNLPFINMPGERAPRRKPSQP